MGQKVQSKNGKTTTTELKSCNKQVCYQYNYNFFVKYNVFYFSTEEELSSRDLP